MQPEGRAARCGHPAGQVIRRVAGGADDQDFARGGNALDEGGDGEEPFRGRGGLEQRALRCTARTCVLAGRSDRGHAIQPADYRRRAVRGDQKHRSVWSCNSMKSLISHIRLSAASSYRDVLVAEISLNFGCKDGFVVLQDVSFQQADLPITNAEGRGGDQRTTRELYVGRGRGPGAGASGPLSERTTNEQNGG